MIVAALAIKGAWRGFFREAFGLLALVVAVAASFFFGQVVAREAAARWTVGPPLAAVGAHALLFVIPYIGIQLLGYLLHRIGKAVMLGGLDRLVGAVFGAATAVLACGALLSLAYRWEIGARWLSRSKFAPLLAEVFRNVYQWASTVVG